MFRVGNVPGAEAPKLHRFLPVICDVDVVEHLLNLPLWIVQAMVMPGPDIHKTGDDRLWDRYLVGDSEALAKMVTSDRWEKFQLYVVLPNYVTDKDAPSIERCTSVWEAVVSIEGEDRPSWYFETESRGFFDVLKAPENARKTALMWKDAAAGDSGRYA